MCASTRGSNPCCSAAVARSSNEVTADSADGSLCAAAADPGGAAHSDKNRNALSDILAIYNHEIVTTPLPVGAPTPCSWRTPVAPGAANDEPPPPPEPSPCPGLFPPPPPPPKKPPPPPPPSAPPGKLLVPPLPPAPPTPAVPLPPPLFPVPPAP